MSYYKVIHFRKEYRWTARSPGTTVTLIVQTICIKMCRCEAQRLLGRHKEEKRRFGREKQEKEGGRGVQDEEYAEKGAKEVEFTNA